MNLLLTDLSFRSLSLCTHFAHIAFIHNTFAAKKKHPKLKTNAAAINNTAA